jgi:phospholipase C
MSGHMALPPNARFGLPFRRFTAPKYWASCGSGRQPSIILPHRKQRLSHVRQIIGGEMFLRRNLLFTGFICSFLFANAFTQTGVNKINHIVILAQENRSFDHYFGQLRQYWAQNGYADVSFDGLPQFNPTSGLTPLQGPAPTNQSCDPALPPPNRCKVDASSPTVTSFELLTECIENTSPSWNEAHNDWDINDPTGLQAAKLNGFVRAGANYARNNQPIFYDTEGKRAMGYYTGNDLNYYYYMASNFATSDRWFQPVMTRTHPNREYLYAATSQGDVYPVGSSSADSARLTAKTILQELQAKGVSWKIYVNPSHTPCTGPPYNPSCLLNLSYIKYFMWGQTIPTSFPSKIAPISEYFTDLKNGTLPQVAFIEPASGAGLDEHPSDSDSFPINIQRGAQYVSTLINGLMTSSSWNSSVFILTFDESGGLYDHVSPRATVSPDGIKPKDLKTNDICTYSTGPTCDFVYTGYRVPLIVVSPFAKKHYVSHTAADLTAILRLIETRFGVSTLTARDAHQMNMTEFFDFTNPQWLTPPTPPLQVTTGRCYLNALP